MLRRQPRTTGLQVTERLKHHRPELRVLIRSMYDNEQYFVEARSSSCAIGSR